jgi:hypothetical protein
MELDLQSLFGLLCTASCTFWLRPRNPLSPPSAFGLVYEGSIGQPRWTTSLCNPLLKTLVALLNLMTHSFVKKYESYVSGAAAALKLILKNFGTVIRTNIDSPSTSVGVDISKVPVLYSNVNSNEKRGGSGR